jgi:hypothetical protein
MRWLQFKSRRPEEITWDELVVLEPRLARLLWRAEAVAGLCRCPSDVGMLFSPLRGDLTDLVGFSSLNRDHPILGSCAAYQAAYAKLREAVTAHLAPAGPSA